MFAKIAVRDLLIIAFSIALWHGLAEYTLGDSPLADFLGVILGLLIGTGGYFLHEWGHFAGALITRSRVDRPATLKTVFLFSFDSKRNSKQQFLVMSLTGFLMTAIVTYAFYTFLPDGLLASRVARGLAVLGVFLALFIEAPLLLYGLFGPTGIPPVEAPSFRADRPGADATLGEAA
jgi:hypothetical protein